MSGRTILALRIFCSVSGNYLKENSGRVFLFFSLIAIFACGYYVRSHGLPYFYLNNDEVLDLTQTSTNSLADYFKVNSHNSGHPFLANIIAYFLLKFTSFDLVFRLKSVLFGLLTIYLFYLAGKKAAGDAAGIIMAAIAAYGHDIIILSELTRQYIQFLALEAGLLCVIISYYQNPENRKLAYIFILSFACLFTYYANIITAAAVALVIGLDLLYRKAGWRVIVLWAGSYLLLFISARAYIHMQNGFSVGVVYYAPSGIVTGVKQWLTNFYNLFGVFSFDIPILKIIFLSLFLMGFVLSLIEKRWRFLSFLLIAALMLNTVLSLLKLYPFSPSRYGIYLLPFVAIISSLPVQYLWNRISPFLGIINKISIYFASFIAVIALSIGVKNHIEKNNFLRGDIIIFNLTRQNYLDIEKYLLEHVGPNDAVIAEGASANYFVYKVGFTNSEFLSASTARINYKGMNIFYNHSEIYPRIETVDEFKKFLNDVNSRYDLSKYDKIWIFRMGWQTPLTDLGGGFGWGGDDFGFIRKNAEDQFITKLKNGWPSGLVYSLKPEVLLNLLKN